MKDEQEALREELERVSAHLRGLQGTLALQDQLKSSRQAHQNGKCIRLPKITASLFSVPSNEAVPNSYGLPTVTVASIAAACEKPSLDVGMGLHVFEAVPGHKDPQQTDHWKRVGLWISKKMTALMGAPSQEVCLEWVNNSVDASVALRNYCTAVLKAYIMGDFTMFMVRTVHYHPDKPADIALMWYLPCIVRHEEKIYQYAFITYSNGEESQLHMYEAVMMDHLALKFTPVIINMVELDGTIVHQNAAAMAAYGMQGRVNRAEGSGTAFNLLHELFSEHPALKAEMEAVTSANNMFSRHMPIRSQALRKWLGVDSNREVWHQVQVSRTRDAVTMRYILVVAQMDVTAAVQAANQVATLQAENDDLAWTTAWLEDEKARTDEVNQRLKESLMQALAIRDQSRPGRVTIDSATPADKAVRLLNKVLEGQEVSSHEVMSVRDLILDAGRDLLQPVNFMAQMGAQMGQALDAEVGQSLIDLLVTQRNFDVTDEFRRSGDMTQQAHKHADDGTQNVPPFWAAQNGTTAAEGAHVTGGSKQSDRSSTSSMGSACGYSKPPGQRCQVPVPYRPLNHRLSAMGPLPRTPQPEPGSLDGSEGSLPKLVSQPPHSPNGLKSNGTSRAPVVPNNTGLSSLSASNRTVSLPAGYNDSSLLPVATSVRHRASAEGDHLQTPGSPDSLSMQHAGNGPRSTPSGAAMDTHVTGHAPAGLALYGSVGHSLADGSIPQRTRVESSRSSQERLIARCLALVPHSPPDHLSSLLAAAEGWGWDPWALNEATGGRPLSCLAYYLLQRHGTLSSCSIDHSRLCRFLVRVEDDYNDANPYHNRVHATDVLQWIHVIMQRGGVFKALQVGDVGRLAVYLSAIVHDLDHRGKTNDFLIKTADPLALLYNDVSPQENHHVAHCHMLLRQPEYNFLEAAPERVRQNIRKQLIMMVLATDMKQHFLQTSLFKSKLGVTDEAEPSAACSTQGSGDCTPGNPGGSEAQGLAAGAEPAAPAVALAVAENDDEIKGLVLALALKCADLGNLAAPLPVNAMWVTALEEEYFKQGDCELAEGLSVSVLMDRNKAGVSKSQTGFFSVVGLPLFRMFVKAFPDAKPMLDSAQRNFEHWRGVEEEVRRRTSQASAEAHQAWPQVTKPRLGHRILTG